MCSDSKIIHSPCDLKMEAGFYVGKDVDLHKNASNLLVHAAMDDLAGFVYEVEERGCDVDEVSLWYGRSFGLKKMGFEERTPIMIAALYGSTEVLKYILETGLVDVNRACGSDGATALHCAAAGGSWSSVEVVELLIAASADNQAVDVDGKKPGDLIAPCVKSCTSSKRKQLEMLLNGMSSEAGDREEEAEWGKTPPAVKEGCEKKEYPIDVSLPDINNGVYGSDEFRMYSFKVKPCSRAYSHDWTECPFVHPGENARRRDPRKYHYTCVPCPEFKKGTCAKGDSCEYAHGVFESWLHPAQYRTRLCKDETGCTRKVCFFAHKHEELRPLYAATGSAMPSPKSVSATGLGLDMATTLSPLSLGSPSLMMSNSSTPPVSPSVTCSSPMGGNMWQSKANHVTPPALQLPGSRLKTAFSARDVDLDLDLLGLDRIRTQHRQQLVEEMASLSPYGRMADLAPTNLEDVFGSLDPSLLSQLQGLSPSINNTASSQLQSPTGLQIRQNLNQLRASYPSNVASSPSRKSSAYGFESSAGVAQAVMNSRSAAFAKRSQSFIDRSSGGGGGYRYGHSGLGSANSPVHMQQQQQHFEWSAPDGMLDWGFNGEEANKLRKSASFGFRSGNATAALPPSNVEEPDVSWVNSLVKDVPSAGGGGGAGGVNSPKQRLGVGADAAVPHWLEQMYIEQEQLVA